MFKSAARAVWCRFWSHELPYKRQALRGGGLASFNLISIRNLQNELQNELRNAKIDVRSQQKMEITTDLWKEKGHLGHFPSWHAPCEVVGALAYLEQQSFERNRSSRDPFIGPVSLFFVAHSLFPIFFFLMSRAPRPVEFGFALLKQFYKIKTIEFFLFTSCLQ